MFLSNKGFNVYLFLGKVDMRKAINGLSVMVKDIMRKDVFGENLFVFCNKNHTRMKILYWDKNGFCLWYKRLGEEKFKWPKSIDDVMKIEVEELSWLLRGLDIKSVHRELKYSEIF